MSFLDQITVLILTHDEAANIARTLDALSKFPEIVVLDSGSSDETVGICSHYSTVRIEFRPFEQHAAQWNYGLSCCGIERPWVLALDADFVLSSALVDEIGALPSTTRAAGFRVSFRYCILGQPLHAGVYPPLVALYRRERAKYVQEGHTQRVLVDGPIEQLSGLIDHDDRKPLARWFASQQRYAKLEAEYLLAKPRHSLRGIERLRLMAWPAPILISLYMLTAKRCVLSGWPGWLYVLQRTLAEIMIAVEIVDRKLRSK